jgi:hypothetical protein
MVLHVVNSFTFYAVQIAAIFQCCIQPRHWEAATPGLRLRDVGSSEYLFDAIRRQIVCYSSRHGRICVLCWYVTSSLRGSKSFVSNAPYLGEQDMPRRQSSLHNASLSLVKESKGVSFR